MSSTHPPTHTGDLLRVAAVQMNSQADPAANVERALDFIDQAAAPYRKPQTVDNTEVSQPGKTSTV